MKLKQISRKFGLDLSYFLPRAFWVGGRFFATTLLALLISVLFARLTTKQVYGQYQYILSVVSLASVFSLPGLNTAALRAFVEGDEEAVAESVRYSFLGSLFGAGAVLGVAVYRFWHGEPTLGSALVVAGLLLPVFYAPNNWYVYYEGKLDFRSSTLRLVAANMLLLVSLFVGLALHRTLVGLITIYFSVNAALTTYFFYEARQQSRARSGSSRLSLAYALRCTLQKFTSTLGENVQAIAVSTLFGFAHLAIYQVAQSFVNAFTGLTGALASTYFPLLLKYKQLNHRLIVIQHLVLGVLCWLVYLGAVRFLFAPLYGAKYYDAISLAYRLSFIIFILPLRIYLTNYFSAKDRNKVVIVTNLGASLLAIGVFVAVKNHGFSFAVILYLYILNILMLMPLLGTYLSLQVKTSAAEEH